MEKTEERLNKTALREDPDVIVVADLDEPGGQVGDQPLELGPLPEPSLVAVALHLPADAGSEQLQDRQGEIGIGQRLPVQGDQDPQGRAP